MWSVLVTIIQDNNYDTKIVDYMLLFSSQLNIIEHQEREGKALMHEYDGHQFNFIGSKY